MLAGGSPQVRGSPGWYAGDAYDFAEDGQLFQALLLHTGGREDWALYDGFLNGISFVDA